MVFVDTNIFIYAHDESDPHKTRVARQVLTDLVSKKQIIISTQVVQEFCNVMLRKSVKPLKTADIHLIIKELLAPLIAHQPDAEFYFRALDTYKKYSLSWYDGLIIQAALDTKCKLLYSEDLQNGQIFGELTVTNPFI